MQARISPLSERVIVEYQHNGVTLRLYEVSSSRRLPGLEESITFEHHQYRVFDVEHRYINNHNLCDATRQEYIILYLKDAAIIQPPGNDVN